MGRTIRLCWAAASCLGLAACGGAAPVVSPVVETGEDGRHFVRPALEATAQAFFAPPPVPAPGAPPAAPAPALRVDIDGDTLSPDSGTAYRQVHGAQIRAGIRLEQSLSRRVSLTGQVLMTRGSSRYVLPDGAGVLTDPITIRFRTTGVEVTGGLAATWPGRMRIESRIAAGLGGTVFRTRTGLQSALLDIRHRSSGRLGFGYVEAGLRLPGRGARAPDWSLTSRAAWYPQGGLSVTTGLAVEF